jgi:GntR family transcriptional regulator
VTIGTISQAAANDEELRHLALEPSAKVYRYRRTYAHEGRLFMIDEVSVPAKIFADLENEKDAAQDIVSLAQRYGLLTGNATERISAGVADTALARDLNVAHGAPLLIFDRVVFELNGLPLEWRLGFCHPADGY